MFIQHLSARTLHKAAKTAASVSKAVHIHQMLGVIIVVAHASEIARVVSEIHLWHLGTAFVLFGLWLATQKTGAELA